MRSGTGSTRSPGRCLATPGTAAGGTCGVGGAGHRRVRGDGARGQAVGGQGRGEAPCDAPHGRKADHAHRPGAVRATQIAVRGAQRPDQGDPRLPAVRRAGNGTWCVRRRTSGGCNRFRRDECALPSAGRDRNHPHRGTRRTFRILPRAPPAIAHFRCPGPRARPRIGSGPSIRSRSQAIFPRRRLLSSGLRHPMQPAVRPRPAAEPADSAGLRWRGPAGMRWRPTAR